MGFLLSYVWPAAGQGCSRVRSAVDAGRWMCFGLPELLEPDSAGDDDPAGSRAAEGTGRGAADPKLGSEPQP